MEFYRFYQTGQFSDVILEIIDTNGKTVKELYCHRIILSAVSDMFNIMFSGSFAESRESKIKIREQNSDIFEEFIAALYRGSLEDEDDNPWNDLEETTIPKSHNLQFNLAIAQLCDYYQVKPDVIKWNISHKDITTKDIVDYFTFLLLVQGSITPFQISVCAIMLSENEIRGHTAKRPKYETNPVIDLSPLPIEIISNLLSCKEYQPKDELITLKIVKKIVDQTNDTSLYNLVKFASFPSKMLPTLIKEYDIPDHIILRSRGVRKSVIDNVVTKDLHESVKAGKELIIFLDADHNMYIHNGSVSFICYSAVRLNFPENFNEVSLDKFFRITKYKAQYEVKWVETLIAIDIITWEDY